MKIHHIGYLVPSIEISAAQFQKIGYKIISPRVFDEERKIFIQFLQNSDAYAKSRGRGSGTGNACRRLYTF